MPPYTTAHYQGPGGQISSVQGVAGRVVGAPVLTFGDFAVPQGNPVDNFQLGIDGLATSIVIGTPKLRAMLGDLLFRPVEVPTINFQYLKYGLERFEVRDAKRAMRAKIQHSEFKVDTQTGKMVRHTWGSLADVDELANADAADAAFSMNLGVRVRYARHAEAIVQMSVERDRSVLALAGTSYSQAAPDLDTTLAGAAEWDSPAGDSRTDIRASVATLCNVTGLQPEDIGIVLSHLSFRAAQDDPTFLAQRGNFATETPNAEELRAYWGVGSVEVGDSYEADGIGGIVSLYGDVAIGRVLKPLGPEYDTSQGEYDSFTRFNWQRGGQVLTPFPLPEHTSIMYPFQRWEMPDQVNLKAAFIIRNTAA